MCHAQSVGPAPGEDDLAVIPTKELTEALCLDELAQADAIKGKAGVLIGKQSKSFEPGAAISKRQNKFLKRS
jgi:hypothetical protein